MKRSELQGIVRGIVPAIREYVEQEIAKATEPLHRRIEELEARPPGFKYCGTFQRGTAYAEHEAVTHQGSLWIARRDTTGEPGTPDSGFQLAVKSGRDGRDGRDAR